MTTEKDDDSKTLERIKKNIKDAFDYDKKNFQTYHADREFVFATSMDEAEVTLLKELRKPTVEFNICEAYISRQRGEFSKQEPSFAVSARDGEQIDVQQINFVEGHLRHLMFEANNKGFSYNTYTNMLSGGFSVAKIWREYENPMSFQQIPRFGMAFDPTLCFFDPLARNPAKDDATYCGEVVPMRKEDFISRYPDVDIRGVSFMHNFGEFSWSYNTGKYDIILICDYYEKINVEETIVQISTGQVMTQKKYNKMVKEWKEQEKKGTQITQAPVIRGKPRKTTLVKICRYRLIENKILEYIPDIEFNMLPLIYFDGNSVVLRKHYQGESKRTARSYIHHAKGVQKLKNFAGCTWANELENLVTHKWIVAKESIPAEYTSAYTDNQTPNVVVFNAYRNLQDTQPLPPPQVVTRQNIPPDIANAFMSCDQTMQAILGNYDASLGINNNQLSGTAIVEAATQSNAAAMPFVVGYMEGLNVLAQVLVDQLPRCYPETAMPQSLPMVGVDGKKTFAKLNSQGGIKMNYAPNSLHVKVEAGVNFAIQKSKALQQIIGLSQAIPSFGQFINTVGLGVVLDNLEIRGADQLKEMAQHWMQEQQQMQQMAKQQQQQQAQMQQHAMMNNPAMMQQQANMTKMQIEQQRLAMDAQQNQAENQLKAVDLANDAESNQNERLKIQLMAQQAGVESAVQIKKADAEKFSKSIDAALKIEDQQHRHTKETIETAHHILTTSQPQEAANESETQS